MPSLADYLSAHGAATSKGGQDTVPALINPKEAALLKAMGGSGRPDPATGMLHFEGGDDGGWGTDNSSGGAEGLGGGSGFSDTGAFGGGNNPNSGWMGDVTSWASENLGFDPATNSYNFGGGATGGGGSGLSSEQSIATLGYDINNPTATGPGGRSATADEISAAIAAAQANPQDNQFDENSIGIGTSGAGPSSLGATSQNQSYTDALSAAGTTGLDGPNEMSDLAGWAAREGLTHEVGTGRNTLGQDFAQWQQENPTLASMLGIGLTFANPWAGLAYNAAGALAGGRGTSFGLGTLGGLAYGTPGAVAGNYLGSLAEGRGNLGSMFSGLAGYGLGASGNSLGQAGYQAAGPLGGALGNYAQGYGLGQVSNALNGLDFSQGSSNPGEATGSSEGTADSYGGTSYAGDYGTANATASNPSSGYSLASYLSGNQSPASTSGYLPTSFQNVTPQQAAISQTATNSAVPISIASRQSDYGPQASLASILSQGNYSAS